VSVPSQAPSDSSRQGAGTSPVASTSDAFAAGPAVGSGEGGVVGGQHWINLQQVSSTDSFDEELEQTAGGQPEVQVRSGSVFCGGSDLICGQGITLSVIRFRSSTIGQGSCCYGGQSSHQRCVCLLAAACLTVLQLLSATDSNGCNRCCC